MSVYEIQYRRKRISNEDTAIIATAEHAVNYAKAYCFSDEELWREKAFAILLNKNNHVLGHYLISVGSNDKTIFDNRMAVKAAIDTMADGIIIIHNHPSQNVLPSPSDIESTNDLKRALTFFDIKLIDHIIMADKQFFSFQKEKTSKCNSSNAKKIK